MTPIDETTFVKRMDEGYFVQRAHKGYIALLYYSAVRKTEGLRAKKEQFVITEEKIFFEVGTRLKHGIQTPPLGIPRTVPYAEEIVWCVEEAGPDSRVWPYSSKTGYNIVVRVFPAYPHFFRLSRITNFFAEGWTIAQVKSWTGLTLQALNYYVGIVDVMKMGESLAKNMS